MLPAKVQEYDDEPNIAGVYDFLLGGDHHIEADRRFGEHVKAVAPSIAQAVLLNRAFLRRVVNYYLSNGVTQFLVIGFSLPSGGNVHEIAQAANPDARVIYANNDDIAVQHSRAILRGNPFAASVHADVRSPAQTFNHPRVTRLLDLDEPVGLLILDVMLLVGDDDRPAELLSSYAQRLAPGSMVAISHLTEDAADADLRDEIRNLASACAHASGEVHLRSRAELQSWLRGELEPVAANSAEHGFVLLSDWHPDDDALSEDAPDEGVGAESPARLLAYGGVARVASRGDDTDTQ